MELKSHPAASKGFEEPLSCGPGQSTVTLYPITDSTVKIKTSHEALVMSFHTSPISPGIVGKQRCPLPIKKKKKNKDDGVCWEFKERSMTLLPADIIACSSSLYAASLYNGSREAGMLLYQTIKLLCWITYNAITNDRMLASHQKFKEQ